jgi:hypothetical protein
VCATSILISTKNVTSNVCLWLCKKNKKGKKFQTMKRAKRNEIKSGTIKKREQEIYN